MIVYAVLKGIVSWTTFLTILTLMWFLFGMCSYLLGISLVHSSFDNAHTDMVSLYDF